MKRIKLPKHSAALLLATLLLAGGLWAVVFPTESATQVPFNGAKGSFTKGQVVHISQTGARIFGAVAVLFGCGLGYLVLHQD